VIPDREEAIRHALSEAEAGDVVVIAGKGHEEYQITGRERRPFSDRLLVQDALGAAP
jgi:UDP-N-acetylmuramoyl-L-alanyl-D-glutamate--2,6-diaminopimelate ligase